MKMMARVDYALEEAVETPIDIEFSKIKVESEISIRFIIH